MLTKAICLFVKKQTECYLIFSGRYIMIKRVRNRNHLGGNGMYKILKAEKLAANIYLMDVEAPRVARHCEPGQFVIVKMDEKGERIPLKKTLRH